MPAPSRPQPNAPVRGTQSFVRTLSACWHRPGVTALEIAWRWLFGIPALLLLASAGRHGLARATGGTFDPATLGLDRALLNDPVGALTADTMGASSRIAGAFSLVLPEVGHAARWLAPLLLLGWVLVSALGRTIVLKRIDPALHARPATLMALHALRALAFTLVLLLWLECVRAASSALVAAPLARGQEPNLVGFCAAVIVLSLGLFVAWASVHWVVTMAPLLAMLRDLGPSASLRAALHLGSLRGKLVEINLVMGIVKIALLVLAMVFSATPLPFESVTTPGFLAWWSAAVVFFYLLGSDFFHVARLVAYLDLWRTDPATNL